MSRRTNSLLHSQLGSSLRSQSYQDLDITERSSASGQGVLDLLSLLPPNDKRFDNLSDTSGEAEMDFAIISLSGSEDTTRFTALSSEGHFSSIHQDVMNTLRQDKEDSLCSTCSSCDSCSTDTWDALGLDEAKINSVVAKALPEYMERQIKEELERFSLERSQRENSGSSGPRNLGPAEPNNMEGLWNMLATYDEFIVTQPGFNIYQQEKPHWLDQEPLPWADREKARRKCLWWLRTYQQTPCSQLYVDN